MMNQSLKTEAGAGSAGNVTGRTFTGRRVLIAILAVLAMLVVAPVAAEANVGLGNSSGNRSGDAPNPLNFGSNAQSTLPRQLTIHLYNDHNQLIGAAQTSSNDFSIAGSGYRRNGGSCNGTATGTSWTTTISGSTGFGSGNSCSIILELESGAAVGNRTGTITFASNRSIENGASRNLTGNVTEENGNVIRVYGPGNETGTYDFGDVAVGDSSTRTFTLRNTGTTAVAGAARALSGTSSDYSITGTTCGAALAVFATCTVDVRFQPTTPGGHTKSLDFTSTSGHSRSIALTGTGLTPVADLSVSPTSTDYGVTPVGVPFGKPFTVTNEGNTTLTLGFAAGPGTDPSMIFRDGGTCGATLAVGNSCTMIVAFSPDAGGPAEQSGSFEVTGTTFLLPQPAAETLNFTGTRGAATSAFDVLDTAGTTPLTSYEFVNAPMDTFTSYTFTLRNTGNVPISNVAGSLSGPDSGLYSISSTTCGTTLLRAATCTVTVRINPSRTETYRAVLNLNPTSSPAAAAKTVALSAHGTGVKINNNVADNLTNVTQKRWLESPTITAPGGLPGDIVRVAFEVDVGRAQTIEGVDIVGNLTTGDTAPGSGYQDVMEFFGSKFDVQRKPGSTQALVTAEVPISQTAIGSSNGMYGYSNGTVDPIASAVCLFGGDYKQDDRRVWFRVRTSDGATSATVGSIVRTINQIYACPNNQGPGITNQRVLQVNGQGLPVGVTSTSVNKNTPVTFQFNTRTKVAGALGGSNGSVDGINWRIRNLKTGDMFRWVSGSYQACAEPCIADSNFTAGARHNFPTNPAGVQTLTIPGIPSRGRWVVEGAPQGSDEDDAHMFSLGSLQINDKGGNSPTLTFGGTLGPRPNTDTSYTISASVADPADPVNTFDTQGGRGQVIEWDLDGNPTNGPNGDGFEFRRDGDSTTGIGAAALTQAFSTVGKTPGPYKIRAKVTDNGAVLAADNDSVSRIFEYDTTINSLPEAVTETVYIEADEDQPEDVVFRATDENDDDYRVDITPDGANTGSLAGNLNGPIGDNTKPYSWPAAYTGTDTFEFVPTDDHAGIGDPGTLTVTVRPNTTIDTSTIAGTLHNPDAGNPTTRFLGSTTDTSASFEFSSPQSPVVAYECRHLLDDDVLEDWAECSAASTGDVSFTDLGDGLHRVEIRAVNDDGDSDGTPVFRTWRVDNTAPVTEVRVGPVSNLPNQQPRLTNDSTPSYNFRATADERSLQQYLTYECRVLVGPNAEQWVPCGNPSDSQGSGVVDIVGSNPGFGLDDPLADGTYVLEVRATDEVGNLGPVLTETVTVDTGTPETALASGPEGLVNTRNLEFVLSSSQGQSTFRCSVVGANVGVVVPMGPCPGPAADGSRPTFTVPADDEYVLTAIAIDPATNEDPTPLEVEFEVDATEPNTTMDPQVDYGNGPTALRRTQSRKVDVTFTGDDVRQLQGFQCRLDSTDDEAWELCQSPQRFGGLSDGPHELGIRAKDEAGNFDSTPEVLEWTVDRTPPVTTITSSPDPVSNDDEPTFEFEADEAISGSVCSLDGAPETPCDSPVTIAELGAGQPLSDGSHQFTVRSTDIAGNVEVAVATVSWNQDTVVPEVVMTSQPGSFTPLGELDFGWIVRDGDPLAESPEAEAECAFDPVDPDNIDPGEWESCGRDLTISEAANTNGSHSLSVRASDAAGNVSPVVAHEWEVLGSKPVAPTVDDSSPADGATTRVSTAFFAFSHPLDGTGALEGLFCSLDGGPTTMCDGNYSTEGLGEGIHEFSVFARDIAGNVSDPTVVQWDVQPNAPATSIDFGPNGLTKQKNASIEFSSDRSGTFECRIDGGAWQACESPLELSGLEEGPHSVSVRAVSTVAPVGVKDPTPPTRNWTVDSIAPDVSVDSAPTGSVVSYNGIVTFSSTEADATFRCKVGEGLWTDCTSPLELTGLTAGEVAVLIRAVDPAGNMTAEPAAANWRVEDPVCPDGFDGIPPNCTERPAVTGPAVKATLASGELVVPSLGPVELPADQVVLTGKRGSDGRWQVPLEGVDFKPVIQTVPDLPLEGQDAEIEIAISAIGSGWGTLPNGGGNATFVLPVRADVQASLAGGGPLIPAGTECALKPVKFDLTGAYNEGANSVTLSSEGVKFPTITGCSVFNGLINENLELPREDIGLSMTFGLEIGDEAAVCPPGQTGTPPNCVTEPAKTAALGKPSIKGSKVVRPGKKGKVTISVKNTGNAAATGVKLCHSGSKKLIKPAKLCKSVGEVAAGAIGKAVLTYTVKRKVGKKPISLTVTASAGNAKSTSGKYTARTGKTGKAK